MLEPELLLDAYRRGIFPMAVNPDKRVGAGRRGDIGWFSPDPRAIIPLDDRFHIPHGLRRVLKQKKFETTFDTDFEAVIRECAKRKEGTWISKEIIESYCNLHRLGHAHSVEVRLAESRSLRRSHALTLHASIASSPVVCMASTSAARSSAKACFIASPTPQRLRWWRWSSGCARAGSCCSTRNGKRRIWRSSARTRFRNANISGGCSEP